MLFFVLAACADKRRDKFPCPDSGGFSAAHLSDELFDDLAPDITAYLALAVRRTDDRVNDLHRWQSTRHIRVEDRAISEAKPAVLDETAVPVDDADRAIA